MGGLRNVNTMQQRPHWLCALVLALLVLPACGGGGGGAAPAATPAALTITTQSLPGGSVGTDIACPPLEATNVQGTPRWDLTAGTLPGGLSLDGAGIISGVPTTQGTFDFTVRVRDDVGVDTQPLTIAVGVIELTVTSGLVLGDAWTGTPLALSTNGAIGNVSFSIETNGSGGALSNANPLAGTVTWTPGVTGGASIVDTIRATDDGSGQSVDLDLSIMVDPTAQHTAGFGTTDVWWIDPNQKFGSHAYASDLQKALVDIGLRHPTSTGAQGTEADELAWLWMRVEILRHVNPLFLRETDGSPGDDGLAISFPFTEPGAGYTKPAAASYFSASPTRYSQMGLTHGSSTGVIGTAWLDNSSNGSCENDTNDGSTELGVFANQITPIFNSTYGRPLSGAPIDSDDVDVLKALLYGLPNPGGRYNQIAYVGRGYAKTLAAVIAHEIGHSLGLGHTNPSEPGSIMNPSARIGPSATEAFTAEDVTRLRDRLPGSGRTSGLSALKFGGMPEGGIQVCHLRAMKTSR